MIARCHSHPIRPAACAALTAAPLLTAAQPVAAQPGWVLSHQKISDTEGGFPPGELDDGDRFGVSVTSLGDLDGDRIENLRHRFRRFIRHEESPPCVMGSPSRIRTE